MRTKVVLATLALLASALAPGATVRAQTGVEPQPGGTLRVGLKYLQFTSNFDPTSEYLGTAWAMYSNLLLRTLVTYRHVAGPEGAELVPDLATEVPEPTDDGLTYTFHLRPGVMFGPPVARPITSRDIKYAFARIKTEGLVAQYGYYYQRTIEGMRPLTRRPRPSTISGIETPDDQTIVFHLTEPTGDFLYRLAMAATAPIPREVARCSWRSGAYGRFVISSGPYMLKGSEGLDLSVPCSDREPFSGYQPGERMTFERNPYYDLSTDDPSVRENLIDEFRFIVVPRVGRMIGRIEEGTLDAVIDYPYNEMLEAFRDKPDYLRANDADRTWYLTMNLTQPPFDDVHVRRAVNLVMDKQGLRQAWGGPIQGEIATHVLPPNMTGGHPSAGEYDPYGSADQDGDAAAARAEMALSGYDSDGDGRCDDKVCAGVMLLNRSVDPWRTMSSVVEASLLKIGIDVEPRFAVDGYTPIITIRREVPLATVPGWGKDYPDPSTFMRWLFHSSAFKGRDCYTQYNYSLVGATPRLAERCGLEGSFEDVPSVDTEIETCEGMPLGDDRTACWVETDRKIMEDVVPWVPYLWQNAIRVVGPKVTRYEFDQSTGEMAFSHMAVES